MVTRGKRKKTNSRPRGENKLKVCAKRARPKRHYIIGTEISRHVSFISLTSDGIQPGNTGYFTQSVKRKVLQY